jgi:hypothetical protein
MSREPGKYIALRARELSIQLLGLFLTQYRCPRILYAGRNWYEVAKACN